MNIHTLWLVTRCNACDGKPDVLMLGGNMVIEPDIHASLVGEFANIFIFV